MRKLLIIPLLLATLIATGCKQKAATTETPDTTDSTAVEEATKPLFPMTASTPRRTSANA